MSVSNPLGSDVPLSDDPVVREFFQRVKTRVEEDGAIVFAQLNTSGGEATTNALGFVKMAAAVADLSVTASASYSQSQAQSAYDKIDEIKAALEAAGIMDV